MTGNDQRPQQVVLETCTVDLRTRQLSGGRQGHLTTREEALLRYLGERAGQTVTQEELLAEVWGYAPNVRTLAVYRAIKRLRDKVEDDPTQPHHLITVRGEGYRFEPLATPSQPAVQPPPPEAPRAVLPTVAGGLVGRGSALRELETALEDTALVTLLGPAGVGKTRLAIEVASNWRGDPVFVDVSEVTDEGELLEAIEIGLGVEATTDRSGSIAAKLALLDAPLLVVDNAEHVTEPVGELLTDLVRRIPELRGLVTSQIRLRVTVERVVRVHPLERDAAGVLLERRARAIGVEGLEREECAALAAALDGLPLAISLAANLCRTMSPRQIQDRLGQRLHLLKTSDRDTKQRHATLRAALAWSWSLLEPWERLVAAQASVFAGGFTLELASRCFRVGHPDAPPLIEVIGDLIDKSFITRSRDSGRFGMLDTVVDYALERLRDPEEPDLGPEVEAATIRRHIEACLALGDGLRLFALGINSAEETERVLPERDNLRLAIERAIALDDPDNAARLVTILLSVTTSKTALDPQLSLIDRVLALSPSPEERLRLLAYRAATLRGMARGAEGLEVLARAQELAEALDDVLMQSVVQHYIGNLKRAVSDDSAVQHYERALAMAITVADDAWEAAVCGNLGVHLWELGHEGAEHHFARAIEIHQALGNKKQEAIARFNLSVWERSQGRRDESISQSARSLRILEELDERYILHSAMANHAFFLIEVGRYEEARELLHRSGKMADEQGHKRGRVPLHATLAEVEAALGNNDDAEWHLSEAYRIAELQPTAGHLRALLMCRHAQMLVHLGEWGKAASLLDDAKQLAETLTMRGGPLPWEIERLELRLSEKK